MAGARLNDRLVACLGAGLGVFIAAVAGLGIQNMWPALPFLIAPIGASAVLVFAVPTSPLAQPWPVFGGNVLSAAVGVTVAHIIPDPLLAVGLAVALAILAMSLLRCLHPPSGAVAVTAIIGSDAVIAAGYMYPVTLVAANSAALVLAGYLFHRISGHSYPHRVSESPAPLPAALLREDIELALAQTKETFDISPADLETLLMTAESFAAQRRNAGG
ncbi:MAG: HPP family protein [Sphingopyxis sp.]|nr:HPP family protein [Sphingopyxis sp.]